ncbi:hypothetical protein ACIBUR_38645 [Streptomyces anulatus]
MKMNRVDADLAIEKHTAELERHADAMEQIARRTFAGTHQALNRMPIEDQAECVKAFYTSIGVHRAAAMLNRSEKGREHLCATGRMLVETGLATTGS